MSNSGNLMLKLEELIANEAEDFAVSLAFKAAIKTYFSSLGELFVEDGGKGFLVRHTRQIDQFLTLLYKYLLRDNFGTYRPSVNQIPIALIALGSYGREQLCVYSDIDLMILYTEPKGYNIRPIIERYINMLWDVGLNIGHRTHTPAELLEAARSDITIKTALMESRFIYGSKFLWMEAQNELGRIRRDRQADYCTQKMAEYKSRQIKYPLTMEPWIKEGVGGLRDANTLYWIALILFGVNSNKELVGRIYSEEEYRRYRQALEFLFRLRSAMHLVAGKKQDRLLFQMQRDVALKLGFADRARILAERALMSRVFEAMVELRNFCALFLERYSHLPYQPSGQPLVWRTAREAYQSNGFFVCADEVWVATHHRIPRAITLYETLLRLPDRPLKFSASMLGLGYAISEPLRQSKKSRHLTLQLLSRDHAAPLLGFLHRIALLERIIPHFKRITNLAQFDGYHARTVDEHTIEAMRMLESLSGSAGDLYAALSAHERLLLKFSLLMHDIAKGGHIDHSIAGARIARSVALELGLDEETAERAALLVRLHTMMSNVALREDIYNEKTILAFVTPLKERRNLALLYLLTIADMQAVAEGVYTKFSAELLRELFGRSVQAFENRALLSETSQRLAKEKVLEKSACFLSLHKRLQKEIRAIPSNLLFIKYRPEEIVRLASWVAQTGVWDASFVNEPHFKMQIIAKRAINLGWLLGKLSFLDITDMDIVKLFDGAKYFRVAFSGAMDEADFGFVRGIVEQAFDMSLTLSYTRPVIEKKGITVDCDHSPTYAKMALNTKNQKGLMAYIIEVFDEFGIDIATAKITTIKNQARDLFLIEKKSGFCEKRRQVLARLSKPTK